MALLLKSGASGESITVYEHHVCNTGDSCGTQGLYSCTSLYLSKTCRSGITDWILWAPSSVVGWGTTSWKVTGSIPNEVTGLFNLPNPSNCTMVLGSTQLLTKMSTKNLPGGKGWPTHKATWQPHCYLWVDCLENVGALTSHNPMGPRGLFQG
jgi:hypothetical protein